MRRPSWYHDAIIYGIDVATFQDSNGDGIGDFVGLCERLDYLVDLGVTCLWLLPFYPTPNRDNGYDVTDYFEVDKRLGTFDDFLRLIHEAGERGIRILIDLVMDHTSDQHPWFRAARRDRASRYRRYYEWTDAPPPVDAGRINVFPGEENSVWTYDEIAGQYYYHRFYHFEPDLNVMHEEVREEIRRVLDYWLSFGISGFRVDAVSHMIESPHEPDSALLAHDPHSVIRELRAFTCGRRPDAVLLGEADVEPDHMGEFFGDGDQLQMLYNFYLNNYLFLALARAQHAPIREAYHRLPAVPESGQWVNFLRNFDELDLERLTDDERETVYRAFAPDPAMRIFGRGIRRRLAPMLDNDHRIRMAYSMLFSLPGTPLFMYGDEIGMGDDLALPGRNSVRTPMQWSTKRNAGFSPAPSGSLAAPVLSEGRFGFQSLNVEDQARNPESMLSWMKSLIRIRRRCPEWGRGDCTILDSGEPGILMHRTDWRGHTLLALHNLSDKECIVRLPVPSERQAVLLWSSRTDHQGGRSASVDVEPYGYHWFRLAR
jgi:maltose alpha-D-glucosyltransferase/alpha-amylase